MAQIKIKRGADQLADLYSKIRSKNATDGEQSYLNPVMDFGAMDGKINKMLDFQGKADEAGRLKEEMNEQKKKMMDDIYSDIKQIRDLLKAHHPNDLKMLGAWGFIVDEVANKKVNELA
jgi:hypothetical protein